MTNRNFDRTGSTGTRGDRGSGIPGIAKYIAAALIIAYVVLLILYASGSTRPFGKVEKAVESSLDTKNLKKAGVQGLKRYYGLNNADYDGVLLYTAAGSISAEEVLLLQVKNDSQIKQVQKAIQKRIENRENDFEGYAPKQVQQLKQAQISVRGSFVFLAVGPKAAEYKTAFSKSL